MSSKRFLFGVRRVPAKLQRQTTVWLGMNVGLVKLAQNKGLLQRATAHVLIGVPHGVTADTANSVTPVGFGLPLSYQIIQSTHGM